jgi:hypothetical protein
MHSYEPRCQRSNALSRTWSKALISFFSGPEHNIPGEADSADSRYYRQLGKYFGSEVLQTSWSQGQQALLQEHEQAPGIQQQQGNKSSKFTRGPRATTTVAPKEGSHVTRASQATMSNIKRDVKKHSCDDGGNAILISDPLHNFSQGHLWPFLGPHVFCTNLFEYVLFGNKCCPKAGKDHRTNKKHVRIPPVLTDAKMVPGRLCLPKVDALHQYCDYDMMYAFPLPAMILNLIQKLRQIAPFCMDVQWLSDVRSLLHEEPRAAFTSNQCFSIQVEYHFSFLMWKGCMPLCKPSNEVV